MPDPLDFGSMVVEDDPSATRHATRRKTLDAPETPRLTTVDHPDDSVGALFAPQTAMRTKRSPISVLVGKGTGTASPVLDASGPLATYVSRGATRELLGELAASDHGVESATSRVGCSV